MGKKRNYSFCEGPMHYTKPTPTIYEKVGDKVILSTDFPKSNLKPDDFELNKLISAGVDVASDVKFESVNSIDRIDQVIGRVVDANITMDEEESKTKKND